jgi:hypothetical protein
VHGFPLLHAIAEVNVPQRQRKESNGDGYKNEILHALSPTWLPVCLWLNRRAQGSDLGAIRRASRSVVYKKIRHLFLEVGERMPPYGRFDGLKFRRNLDD